MVKLERMTPPSSSSMKTNEYFDNITTENLTTSSPSHISNSKTAKNIKITNTSNVEDNKVINQTPKKEHKSNGHKKNVNVNRNSGFIGNAVETIDGIHGLNMFFARWMFDLFRNSNFENNFKEKVCFLLLYYLLL